MATERLSMRQTREILRQKWRLGRTHREVAQSLGISCGAVGTTVLRARAAELFVAVLGASNYTYAEATRTQQVPDWVASHQRAFQFFGGVTAAIVPDQLKSGVVVPCRYEPGVQRTYDEFALHYGTVILPARPAKPRDKAKIEVAVQVAERWILARLRHETFFSLAALNARIAELLADLNARPMRLYRASRRELFERLDQPALRPLPAEAFVYSYWKIGARVNIDYHIELHGHYYSVPYALLQISRSIRSRSPSLNATGLTPPTTTSSMWRTTASGLAPNCSGGVQGGITSGETIYFRVAFKPTATIMREQHTVDIRHAETTIQGRGRHDPCVLPRAVPMVEAMTALVIADHALRQQAVT